MRYFTTQICDNPNGEECQYEDIDSYGRYLIFEPLGSALDGITGEELHYCENCAEDVINEFINDKGKYPRLKEKDESGYEVRYGEKKIPLGAHCNKIVPEIIIYYSLETGNQMYEDIEKKEYCE